MKKLFIFVILFAMIVFNECADSECTRSGEAASQDQNQQQQQQEQQEQTPEPIAGGRRRMEASEKKCPEYHTSDDKKFKCVFNKDEKKCEEAKIESESTSTSNMIKISLFLLISMLFI